MWIKANKSRNLYKINPLQYIKILQNKITEKYKLDYDNTECQINNDTYKLTNSISKINEVN